MKLSQSFFYTLREAPKDEDSISSSLLVRSGMIKKSSNGIYIIMPMGKKVLEKVENIVREEMNSHDAQELLMPALIPEDIYVASGRRENFGKNMFTLEDRYAKKYALGPTHEEMFTLAAMMDGKSYKDFPYNLYQIQTKYRDETRPRYGLIRVREFIMKDAYSFDTDPEGLEVSYQKMADAYNKIMDRLGLEIRVVKADTGAMGGLLSEEYQAISTIGEDTVLGCDSCDYSSNLEIAEVVDTLQDDDAEELDLELVYTPNAGTIEEVSSFLNKQPSDFVKTLIYKADGNLVAFMLPGDRELNETKASKALGALELTLAEPEDVMKATGARIGFAGPVGLEIPVYMDRLVAHKKNFIVGANKSDHHYLNCNLKNFTPAAVGDYSMVKEGDVCPNCGGKITFDHGIEVGNLFKLGTKYAESMGLYYADPNNQLKPVWMGCYGIGLERCMAAVADQHHDEHGLIWPLSVAPFRLAIVPVSMKDENQVTIANELYDYAVSKGYDVLLDDRNERPGVKFKDMELIGIPNRLTIGRGIQDGKAEFVLRDGMVKKEVALDDLKALVDDIYANDAQNMDAYFIKEEA